MAATAHYLDTAERHCTYAEKTKNGPTVRAASGHTITAHKRAQVPLAKELSTTATEAHIFTDLQSGSLVSIGQLWDDNCVALFAKSEMAIFKDGAVIIQGKRDATNGLWSIPLNPSPQTPPRTAKIRPHSVNSIIQTTKTQADLAAFLHGYAFSPVPSTFLRAISRGHFDNWPGLTTELISKYLPKSMATSLGHLRMQQKSIQYTKKTCPLAPPIPLATSLDISPAQELFNATTQNVFLTTVTETTLRKSYSDQTNRFPAKLSRGNQYIFVFYDLDSNIILTQAIPNRQAKEITNASTTLHSQLQQNGAKPTLHILDNECSHEPKKRHSKNTRSSSNSSPPTTTAEMPPNAPFKPGIPISSPDSPLATPNSH